MNKYLTLAIGVGLTCCLLAPARAESLLTTNGKFFAWPDTDVPGLPGVHFAGTVDFSTLAEDGTLAFRADMYGTGTSGINSRALFKGSSAATLSMMARWNDTAPGLPGLSLVNIAGTQGIGSSVSISPSGGYTLWSSPLSGSGVTTTNDTALFRGSPGGHALIAREGAPAPGTTGAVYSGTQGADYQFAKVNRNGTVLFRSTLAGGDVVGTTNDAALYTGTPGALTIIVRKGDTVIPPSVKAASGTWYSAQLDNTGRVLYDMQLSGTGVTTTNNDSIWFYTPGSGSTLLVREGDPAPGTAGATLANISNNFFISPTSLTRSGRYEFTTGLSGGDVSVGVNDTALYAATVGGGKTLIARGGQPAPGTDAFFQGFSLFYSLINDAGDVAFQATLTGGTSDASNNTGVWIWKSGTLSKVVRKRDPVAGMPGTTYDSFIGQNMFFNDLGQILVVGHLHGGEINYNLNATLLLAWDPVKGLFFAARNGEEPFGGAPGSVRTTRVFSTNQFNNSDGVSLSLGKNGTLGLTVFLNDGSAVATVDLNCYPATVYGIDGDGDGYGDVATRVGVCSGATPPAGYIPNATDCNDQNPAVFKVYYHDADGDGYGNAGQSICDDATPPAGYVVKNTDCVDTNPAYHPLAPDATCNAFDDNCNGRNDDEYADVNGWGSIRQDTCGFGACAGYGESQCSDGIVYVITPCVSHPGNASPETCNNGIDEDCDGTVDDPIPTGTPTVALSRLTGGVARLTWTSVAGATGYDVARGSMQVLASSHGDFTAATNACLGNNLAATTFSDTQPLAPGQGYWYVLRATSCGSGSYNSGSPRQVGSRDAEIAASPSACP